MDAIKSFFTALLYQPLFNALVFLAWLIPGHSIGWAIIALTVIIRIALMPSSLKTLEHQRRMKELQPKIDALKNKHGKDQAAHSKALMELYAAEKISPFSACLPSLVQLPVLLAMYQVFMGGLNTDRFDLLYSFTPHMDTINTHWLGLDLTKPEYYVIPLLAAGFQYWQARQMQALTPMPAPTGKGDSPEDVSAAMTKQLMYIAPAMTFFLAFRLPAALGLYWVATTAFIVAQQAWFMRRPLPALSASVKTKDNVTVTIRSKGADRE